MKYKMIFNMQYILKPNIKLMESDN